MPQSLSIGQLENSLAKAVSRLYVEMIGHGPRETRVYILEDMVIIRLKGRLLLIEEKLLEDKEGVSLVKNMREVLHEVLVKRLNPLVEGLTNHRVVSAHSDVSTRTGEMLEMFILDTSYASSFRTKAVDCGNHSLRQ